jgi:hypothetical protein
MRPLKAWSASTAAMNRSISSRQASGDPSLKRYLMRKCFIGFSLGGAQSEHQALAQARIAANNRCAAEPHRQTCL